VVQANDEKVQPSGGMSKWVPIMLTAAAVLVMLTLLMSGR
jgi:hypothetical protein